MQKTFTRQVGSLSRIFDFTKSFFREERIDREHHFAVNLVVEELFVNMVRHNPDNHNDILISLGMNGNRLTISLTDFDVEPFDLTQVKTAPVDLPIEEREPGGLGIHLVRTLMDTIDYEYADRQSRITATKALG